ncbi:MAG: hypothetical protein K0Q57_117 [Gammaproteobacteria bacterium]|jgi:TPP-dependent pyruvate/acetoin dehydrogenase alpha subunit|nr:hypothetical protein [Gammaproteobacteria bacterium]
MTKKLDIEKLYTQMLMIRLFEQRLLSLFSEGKLFGTTHTYIGQEATAVALVSNLQSKDIVFSNHRCHGHYLAIHEDMPGLLAEITGKEGGLCAGKGGSQHICRDNFYSNGVQGGYMPIVVGMAYAEKIKQSNAITVAFIGDGTLGEGAVYEALNMASLYGAPLLIVVENNRYAQTTPIELNLAGKILDRFTAFGIDGGEIESNDVLELSSVFEQAVDKVRLSGKPYVQVIHTYRLMAHSKGDDFRSKEEIDFWWGKDPIKLLAKHLSKEKTNLIEKSLRDLLQTVEDDVLARPSVKDL